MLKERSFITDLIIVLIASVAVSFGVRYILDKYQTNKLDDLTALKAEIGTASSIIANHNDDVLSDMDTFLSSVQLSYDELHIIDDINQKLTASNADMGNSYFQVKNENINENTLRSNHSIPANMGISLVTLDLTFTSSADMITFLESIKPENTDVLYVVDYLRISGSSTYTVAITLLNFYYDTLLDVYTSIFSAGSSAYMGMFSPDSNGNIIVENGEYTFDKLIKNSRNESLKNSEYLDDYSLTKSSIKYENGSYYLTLYESNNYFAVIIEKEYTDISNCSNLLDLRA